MEVTNKKGILEYSQSREVWIDWLRITSIFLVLVIHSTEPFYLGGEGGLIETGNNAFWVSLFDSFARACVPLFVIASSYLQFPLKYQVKQFFIKRFIRVIIPFFIWTIIYALVWGEPIENFQNLILNFNYAAGHLWFVYMLVGLYLLIPLLSPWAEKVSKRELQFYLIVCFITTFIPFIREIYGGLDTPVIYGPSGIPNITKYPLWGECSWNSYGIFYYFCGFIGYLLFGLYVRRFSGNLSGVSILFTGVLPWLIGFGITFSVFLFNIYLSVNSGFPLETTIGIAALWETPLFYDSTGVALMAIGWIFIYKKFNQDGRVYWKLALPLSKASYGVYLCHMLILVPISNYLSSMLGTNENGVLGYGTVPSVIILTSVITFILSSIGCMVLGKIPKIGKYIVG